MKKWLHSSRNSHVQSTGDGKCEEQITGDHNLTGSCEFGFNHEQHYHFENTKKDETHTLTANNMDTFSNKIGDASYSVDISQTFKGQMKVSFIKQSEWSQEILNDIPEDEINLPRLGLFVVKTSYQIGKDEATKAGDFNESVKISNNMFSTIVAFDSLLCSQRDPTDEKCNTLARIYHHIYGNSKMSIKHKSQNLAYNTDSRGKVISVVKKP